MLKSKSLSRASVALFALLLAAMWIAHLVTIKHHGARYTYSELGLFAISTVAVAFFSIQYWGPIANKFIAGWAGATVLAVLLHVAFDCSQFSATSNAPWMVALSALLIANVLAALTVHAPAFLALFAVAAWLSRRLSIWHSGIFAVAGSIAMIAGYIALGINVDFFTITWWPWRAVDVAIGALAGFTFCYIARPKQSATPVSV